MKYAIVDWYESDGMSGEILGIDIESKDEVERIIYQRSEDTDGECDIQVYDDQLDKEIYSQLMEMVYN